MSAVLKKALDDYYKMIKGERANYQACYKSFLEYCNQKSLNCFNRCCPLTCFKIIFTRLLNIYFCKIFS